MLVKQQVNQFVEGFYNQINPLQERISKAENRIHYLDMEIKMLQTVEIPASQVRDTLDKLKSFNVS